MKPAVKLPIGIENFEKLRTEGFYYVDKTGLITELLNNWSEVNLFTRPRRFGKSLNMSMLEHFFSRSCNPKLFDGLAISREKELCEKYMGKFPVISLTLKGVEAGNYEDAVSMLCVVIGEEALRFRFLLESERLSEEDKEQYARIIRVGSDREPMFPMEKNVLISSLRTLSALLHKHLSGKGYSDILIKIRSISMGIVIELKYSESRNLEPACLQALKQIEEKNYAARLIEDDMTTILKYGIACRRNTCMVKMADG